MDQLNLNDKPKRFASADVLDALRRRHPRPEWEVFTEVSDSTGMAGSGRRADAIAVATWPSRGFSIVGYEVKVSRSDWLAEVANPKKADPLMAFCDRWFVAAPPKVVMESEVPETWGYLMLTGGGLRVKVDAPKLTAKPIDRGFMAGLIRQTGGAIEREISRRVAKALADERAAIESTIARRVAAESQSATRRLQEEAEAVRRIKAACGGQIPVYESERNIAARMKLAAKLVGSEWEGVGNLVRDMRQNADQIEGALKKLIDGDAALGMA